MHSLIERFGGDATVAPSMREVPLEENANVFAFAEQLLAGQINVVVFMTGVGARALLETWKIRYEADRLFKELEATTVVVRGPKPMTVLREWGVGIDHRVPEPNTWRELLETLDENVALAGSTIAIQEYGEPNEELYEALRNRNATVVPVPVYKWAFPEDTGPLKDAIRRTIAGDFQVLMFTSAQQIVNTLRAAADEGLEDDFRSAANNTLIASIGPTATERLQTLGFQVDVEASPPKMGPLVRAAIETAQN
ncbi:uroporphyrinogen-III synthase [Thalassoroseus pseudoceratinae]|uniref:uroporphyrinogen-III synthase n=1 Tax=Thalassoroseus pseudoceratinae TaxID=2713176 RepID=UPI001F100C80|nr:uroporphyrinogen-III synthase [Thalassoroseus pseudoceratinae]